MHSSSPFENFENLHQVDVALQHSEYHAVLDVEPSSDGFYAILKICDEAEETIAEAINLKDLFYRLEEQLGKRFMLKYGLRKPEEPKEVVEPKRKRCPQPHEWH
jgi:hypothetical protein